MKRIGIASSKIAKGNIFIYNMYVILFTCLVALLLFFVVGCVVTFALILISYIGNEITHFEFADKWETVFLVSIGCLTIVISIFSVMSLAKNLKLDVKK